MKKTYLYFTAIIFCLSCNDQEYPERYDLNNYLLEYVTQTFHYQSMEQLENLLGQDSSKYADILELRHRTSELLGLLDSVKDQMIEASGGYDINGLYFDPHSTTQINQLMFNDGLATKLNNELDKYTETLSNYGLKRSQISFLPQKNPLLRNDPRFHDISTEQLHFQDVNLVEAIAALQIYRSSILLNEGLTINLLLMNKCAP